VRSLFCCAVGMRSVSKERNSSCATSHFLSQFRIEQIWSLGCGSARIEWENGRRVQQLFATILYSWWSEARRCRWILCLVVVILMQLLTEFMSLSFSYFVVLYCDCENKHLQIVSVFVTPPMH
jgi:hypothetical protein